VRHAGGYVPDDYRWALEYDIQWLVVTYMFIPSVLSISRAGLANACDYRHRFGFELVVLAFLFAERLFLAIIFDFRLAGSGYHFNSASVPAH
jgi:hypothetical protein